jgi:hypothetical protein
MLRLIYPRLITAAVVLAIVVIGAAGYALAAGFSVSLTSSGPQPSLFTAALGDTVTVVNRDSATHTVVDRQTGLQSPALVPGQSFEFVLTKSGRLTYQQDGPPRGGGTITVLRTGTVTLKSSRGTVAYGSPVVLSGTTSLPTFPVKIEQRTKGDKLWTDVTTLTPSADGAFSFTVNPKLGADFRADVFAGELLSPALGVAVRPIVTLTPRRRTVHGGALVTLRARVVPAAAASSAQLMRLDSRRQDWKRVATGRVSGGTVLFRWHADYGRSVLRVFVTRRGLAKGFSATSGGPTIVVGTGTAPRRGRHR